MRFESLAKPGLTTGCDWEKRVNTYLFVSMFQGGLYVMCATYLGYTWTIAVAYRATAPRYLHNTEAGHL
jgi:hypothetical protein